MRRLLVNDRLDTLGERTFWHLLRDWFSMEFVGGDYATLAERAASVAGGATLLVRNATWFPAIRAEAPQIALLQDIFEDGPVREMQDKVLAGCDKTVFNSEFTRSKYGAPGASVVPLSVDFDLFQPSNRMGLQQALSLPDGCVCWVGAQSAVKGYDIFLQVVRTNPDIPFVAVFKDRQPDDAPPNLRMYTRLTQQELARVMGACRVGLCTSRSESQHLAGIEMGACGLRMVASPVGVYWKMESDVPVTRYSELEPRLITEALRAALGSREGSYYSGEKVRAFWQRQYDQAVIRHQWARLIEEVEHSGA